MTQTGVDHRKRGIQAMRIGAAMLVFGVAIALAFSYGQEEPSAVVGLSAVVALAGFITAIIGLGKWRERPAGND
jgi:hypothetical protein